ncbi:MAG: M23 family metallopeptidase [Pelagibacteraceae bacterium]|jgi:murein DD-endopeptidase MepM/ murein hydrolase activator NlpD|nr:M23 family metallopeptidase [Pelagibacteraceae bacterium]
MNKLLILSLIFFTFKSLNAAEFSGTFYQGNFIIGKTTPKSIVLIDKKKIKVSKQGFFAFGLSKDRKNDLTIEVINDNINKKIIKKVLKKKYKIQRIDGLPKKQVTPPKEVYARIKNDNKLISKARSVNSDLTFFNSKFNLPLTNSIITGVYGSQRVLNGIPKSPHYGLDFAAKEGTKIKAMLDGVVTLSEKDMYYTGGTVIFDHGHGISTLYMHMKDIFVNNGQTIKQGDVIGTVGKTGRSTGPHLDVRLNWFNVKLDPASVLNLN